MNLDAISRAILYASTHYQDQPPLERLAAQAGLSPGRFQRAFQSAVGISPKSFVAHLTALDASQALRAGKSVLDASLGSGLSGPGRLHDLMIKVEGATPGEIASQGQGLTLFCATLPTPCGPLFAALAPHGLAFAAFAGDGRALRQAQAGLKRLWPKARIKENPPAVARAMRAYWKGSGKLQCWVPGTPFQLQVWRALVTLPAGAKISYQGLAAKARLKGARAVGGAVAANPVALLIPCHRVIQSSGAVGGYHWGAERKRALLALEGAEARKI
jgi:AraC family transcriptional regulator of adaptative response/methylated-DNA-[protein]-cysteine methyltransferase